MGASSHLDYQEALKVEASASAVRFKVAQESAAVSETSSMNRSVNGMRTTLAAIGIEIARSTCWTHFQKEIDNNFIGVSPQKAGGVALPSHLDKRVANVVGTLCGKNFFVFREEVPK